MDATIAIFILGIFQFIKHKLKTAVYLDDTYNYAFASLAVWSKKPIEQLLFDKAANASTASSPPFYPTLYRFLISKTAVSPLTVQSFFDWLTQVVLMIIINYELSFMPAVIAVLLFNLSPVIFKDTLYFTDRLWATTVLWLNFWSLSHYYYSHDLVFLILTVAAYGILILSHKHSFQMLLICYLVLSLLYATFDFLFIIVLAELTIYVFTLGFSWEIHKEHARLLGFAWRYLFPGGNSGYGRDQLLFLRKQKKGNKDKASLVNIIFLSLMSNWDYILYICAITILAAGVYGNATGGNIGNIQAAILVTIILTAILTQWLLKLKFIGEGIRYLQYALFPAVLAVWPFFTDMAITGQMIVVVFVGLWSLVSAYINLKTLKATSKNIVNLIDSDFQSLTEEIKKQPWDNFIVLPIQKTYAFAWLTGKKILHFLGARGFWQARDWFPQIRRPLPTFYDEYNINYIVLDDRHISVTEIDLGPVHEILRVNSWAVFKVDRPDEVSPS